MENINSYRDLDVWQQSRELVKLVYQLTKKFPKDEQFGLISQCVERLFLFHPILRKGVAEIIRKIYSVLFFARGSLYEIETQLILVNDLGFIINDDLQPAMQQVTRCKKLINGFINYFQKE